MLIGVDLDNTVVCYDQLFYQVAVEKGLIPADVSVSKAKVRDFLRQHGREDAWIELQGGVYGAYMQDALPFPGVLDFLARCKLKGVSVCIVSHRTRYPFQGPVYDLHQAAYEWLESHGFYDSAQIGLAPDQVYLELTKEGKLGRIAELCCTHFIDDLPEFLEEPGFPTGVQRILFDPNDSYTNDFGFRRVASWTEIQKLTVQ